MTIDQFISDAHEVTEYLLKEFNQDKILVVGHSWGTALGLLLVQKYPELYYAYVGSAQEITPSEGERLVYQYLLEAGKDNVKAMEQLASINNPDNYLAIDNAGEWYEKIKIERKWLIRLGGEIYNDSDYSLLFNMKTIIAPEYTWMDFINFGKGSAFSLKEMWPEVMALDLMKQVPEVKIPVYFFQGRHDYNTPATLVEKYYAKLIAPVKELVWFENSGHHPMYEETDLYEKYLVEKVLPICR